MSEQTVSRPAGASRAGSAPSRSAPARSRGTVVKWVLIAALLLFLGRGFGEVVPYVVMIAVLLVRPSGLFGTKELTRV